VRALGTKCGFDLLEDVPEIFHGDLSTEVIEDFDEPAHMSSFELMGQVYEKVKKPDSVLQALSAILDRDGVAQSFDTDLVDGDVARVRKILNVRDGQRVQPAAPLLFA